MASKVTDQPDMLNENRALQALILQGDMTQESETNTVWR
jgi:hypothetical protein